MATHNPPPVPRLPDGAKVGGWWHELPGENRLVCDLCPRACALQPGDRGFCFVRENRDQQMVLSTYGRSTGFCIDPIEKKPLNHFYPGTSVLSFGTAGCNLGCKFCQNWDISKSREVEKLSEVADPATIAHAAQQLECRSVAFTYNDPVIWAEYAIDTARACRQLGIRSVAVTAGYITPAARPTFFHAMDAANVDLKGFTEQFYYQLTASHLAPVLDTLRWLKHESNVWFEITNLIIPDENDSPVELQRMCDWILQSVGAEVPVHFTAFHPDFRLRDRPATPLETLLRAHETARRTGLKYVYVGNVHRVEEQSTYCPNCQQLLIERNWHQLGQYHLRGKSCEYCGHTIAGHFDAQPGNWGGRRQPVSIGKYASEPSLVQPALVQLTLPAAEPSATSPATTSQPPEKTSEPPESQASPSLSSVIPVGPEHYAAVTTHAWRIVLHQLTQRDWLDELPEFASIANMTVMGAFVTVKRQGRLRGCCGVLGQPMELSRAIEQAARRTATEDTRMPPVSPSELPFLSLDVTLLGPFESLTDVAQRRSQVLIGTHGLRIERDGRAGLLLPSVPIEQGWDVDEFLRQVCVKAGLPTTAWCDSECKLERFAGLLIPSQPPTEVLSRVREAQRASLGATELAQLTAYARDVLVALLQGNTPQPFPQPLSHAQVSGVILSLQRPTSGATGYLTRISSRPPLALRATLEQLLPQAAQLIRQQGPGELNLSLGILEDPAMQGTLAEPDLRGFSAADRCLLAICNGKSILVRQFADSANGHVEALRRLVSPAVAAQVSLTSFRQMGGESDYVINGLPRPESAPYERSAGVAGRFYPADPSALSAALDNLWPEPGEASSRVRSFNAIMLPHAGWAYSGRIAAQVLQRTQLPRTILVFGPKHAPHGVDFAVAPCRQWNFPGGALRGNWELAQDLAHSIDGWQLDAAAHRDEHSIEVELPLIHRLAPAAEVVGVVLQGTDWAHCQRFGQQLARWLDKLPAAPLLVISSDMNHFANEPENRRLDEIALQALQTLDPEHLLATVRSHRISMCGVVPAVIVLEALRLRGALHEAELVTYGTSADTTGDSSRVVGYAGMTFC